MGRARTASTEIARVELSDGDWIEVKAELSVKDARRISQAIGRGADAIAVARALSWIHDWSLRGSDDKPIPLTEAGIDALAMRSFGEINQALDAHIEAADAVAEKNAPSDPPSSSPTSTSAA